MTAQAFDMTNGVDAIDPMVLTLRGHVAPVLSDDARFRFELCVTEALTNIVTHAAGTTAPIQIILTIDAGHARIEIFDPEGADPFDLRAHANELSQVDAMAESGRGLGLIMECSDKVTYGPTDTQNALTLEFRDTRPNPDNAAPEKGIST